MTAAEDRGLLLGDGLFETVLWEDGRLVDWAAHIERLTRGCAALALPPPPETACEAAAREALRGAGPDTARAAVRLTWSAGPGGRGLDRPDRVEPRLSASASVAQAPAEPATLAIVAVRRNSGSPSSRLKTLSYVDNVLARAEARARGADEALMLNERGELACAAAANLFWIAEGRLFTPALDCGVLDGTVRARVLAAAKAAGLNAAEVRAPPSVLESAEAVFLTNSLFRLRVVSAVDGKPTRTAPVVQTLAEAVRR